MISSTFKILILFLFVTFFYCNCKDSNPEKEVEDILLSASLPIYTLPQDVVDSCSVDETALVKWFAEGRVTENGFVNPANSVAFTPENNCSFYTWSEQMFLWLTSNGTKYGGGTTVLESPVFYVVSPLSSDTTRTLMPYRKGDPLNATVGIAKADTEEGQATANVLLDRNGNIVYYITFVNDVYAALLHMAAQDNAKVTRFPTEQAELNEILAYANQNNLSVLEPNTLAIELKSSWVKLEGDMKKQDFVTISADVPFYEKKTDSLWVLTEEETTTTLALVGIHIVGSANGHPEMIWSTFEHKYNSPKAMYQYVNKESKIVNVGPDSAGYWIFNSDPENTTVENANLSYADFKHDTIVAKGSYTIKPSNTIRVLPWGSAYNLKPNQQNPNPAYANSQVVSINNSIVNNLLENDVRKNYLFIGSTWTFEGLAPNGKAFTESSDLQSGVAIGTSNLANSTMETDFQEKSIMVQTWQNHTCFTCHSTSPSSLDPKVFGLSHVFKPLMKGLQLNP